MPQHFSLLRRAALAITAALSLAACNRADYALLPKSPAYLGSVTARVAPRPAASPVAATPTEAAPVAAAAPVMAAAPAPRKQQAAPAKLAPKAVATVAAAQPATSELAPLALVPTVAAAPAVAPKPNLVQRLMLKKVSKQLDKVLANAPQLKQRSAAAGTARLDSNLRTGIILIVVGLLLALFGNFFAVIGGILAVIGLVFILLWVLDQA